MRYTKASKKFLNSGAAFTLAVILVGMTGCEEQSNTDSSVSPNPVITNEPPADGDLLSDIEVPQPSTTGQAADTKILSEPSAVKAETLKGKYPNRFTDRFIFPAMAASDDLAERNKAEQPFEMVFVQGDVKQGIKPFYLSKTEVRLEMFYPWAMGYGMGWSDIEVKQRAGFYPSQYLMWFQSAAWQYDKRRPALAMRRTAAEQYCQTLTELTGRRYRLPTEAEWEHALTLGGGVPRDKQALLKIAHLATDQNFQVDSDKREFGHVPALVGTRSPDRLGLHDLLGNAAEWVADTGKDRVVRGGHFELPAEDFDAGWRVVEDIEVWNETYPNLPVPSGLYRDFPYTGIRLACDADEAPRKASEPEPSIP